MDTQQQRRLGVLRAHLGEQAGGDGGGAPLAAAPTAAGGEGEERQYSVALPEKLTPSGPWLVRRWGGR